ncbi:MAG: hypothetical protein FGM15_08450 [Chthoniobacterales bacterium]|nr:hypothetical protein [Chthoniobacterales bacterium]
MIANRPRHYGKRAFLAICTAASLARAEGPPDPGWRLMLVPSFERPAQHERIPGSETAIIAAAREIDYGGLEYATTRGAWRRARETAREQGDDWLSGANIEFLRDKKRVVKRILITGDGTLTMALPMTPAFYRRFEPILGDGFYVVVPDRTTIALYPRLAGGIPAAEAAMLLEKHHMAVHPVSREVFRATRDGIRAEGVLTDE